jgi:branched-chain amino acid transport system substrate-binding protein
VVADDERTRQGGAAMEKLIKIDKVDLMLSTISGPLNVAGATVAEKYQKFYMITTCWPFLWVPQKFKWSAFLLHPDSGAEVPFKIGRPCLKGQAKKPALVMEDSLDGRVLEKASRPMQKNMAIPLPWMSHGQSGRRITPQILKMKATKVDAMLLFGSPPIPSPWCVR